MKTEFTDWIDNHAKYAIVNDVLKYIFRTYFIESGPKDGDFIIEFVDGTIGTYENVEYNELIERFEVCPNGKLKGIII